MRLRSTLERCESLRRVACIDHLNLVTFLLDKGAKLLSISNEGPELLHAARSSVVEIFQLLIDRGFSTQGPRSLIRAAVMDSVQVVSQLIDHGVRTNVKNRNQQTSLHLTVLSKRMERQVFSGVLNSRNEVIKLLIEKGADVNAVDANGKTALDIAIELGYSDAAEIFNEERR